MNAIDLSAYTGLGAVFLATANICIGLLIAVRYSPVRYWPHRRINIFFLHNLTAYGVLGAVLLHPAILLFSHRVRFRIFDVLLPIHSPLQPIENTLGAVALYLLLAVLITSLYRIALGRKLWKLLHYLVYPAAVLFFIHGILADPNLKTGHADLLDGGKVFVEICLLIIILASVAAFLYRRKRSRSIVVPIQPTT